MLRTRVAGKDFVLEAAQVQQVLTGIDPEPIKDHVVVVGGHRYPPKQVLAAVTGLDRADFTTHQARSILRRLGFGATRRRVAAPPDVALSKRPPASEPSILEPFAGQWIAQDEAAVLFHADSVQAVLRWLRRNDLRARVWRVPATPAEAGSMLSST